MLSTTTHPTATPKATLPINPDCPRCGLPAGWGVRLRVRVALVLMALLFLLGTTFGALLPSCG